MGEGITDRQAEALAFIRDTIERRGRPPTYREMGLALGIASTNGVRYFLDALESKGLIERDARISRGIRLTRGGRIVVPLRRFHARGRGGRSATSTSATVEVPLLGRVAAGQPHLAEQHVDDILRLDAAFFAYSEGTFALRVKGDSMKDAGILDGDIVVVRPDNRPSRGDIVVAYWQDEATVKRFFRNGDRIVLRPENESYEDIVVEPRQEDFRILGRVVGVLRRC